MEVKAVRGYARKGRQSVKGWLARVDAEIITTIVEAQAELNLVGGVAEIGVHHGKSFILLALALQAQERALCIDLFSLQGQNLDQSGKGDLAQLQHNLRRFGVTQEQVVIREQSSLSLTPQNVLDSVGPVRFFSVDGGHWLEAARSDLTIAEKTLAPYGVIALDDFHRPEWPEVSAGLFAWFAEKQKPIVPLLIGYNKLYLCEKEWVDIYRQRVLENLFLRTFVAKVSTFMGEEVPVLTSFALPEYGLSSRAMFMLRSFAPEIFASLNGLLSRPMR